MKREIKFRAWDKEDKRMIVHKQDFIPLNVTSMGVFRLIATSEEDDWRLMPIERFHLMQFTGLLCNKGFEIYEEDISEFAGNRCVVRYYDNMMAFGLYFPHDNSWLHVWECENKTLPIDVIGNTFTHPQLLQQ